MTSTPAQHMVDRLRNAASLEQASDAELLDAYVNMRSEFAFGEIVRRHGPMVWGVCSRMLTRGEDAEDAYQATFSCWCARPTRCGRAAGLAHGFTASRITSRSRPAISQRGEITWKNKCQHCPSRSRRSARPTIWQQSWIAN